MQISDKTLSILRNFSEINKNLAIKPGKTLTTISESKSIMASADIDIEFTQELGIYDTSEFLSCLSLIESPSIELSEKYLTISGQGNKLKYYFAESDLLIKPEESNFVKVRKIFDTTDDKIVELSESQYLQLKRAAATLKVSNLKIEGTDKSIVASVSDKGNSTANSFSLILKDYEGEAFEFNLNMDNLKILKGDYTVTLSEKGISKFKNNNIPLTYFVPLDKSKKA